MVRGWVDRGESISQRFPESLSYFGDYCRRPDYAE